MRTLLLIMLGWRSTLEVRLQMHLAHSSKITSLVEFDSVASTSTTPIVVCMYIYVCNIAHLYMYVCMCVPTHSAHDIAGVGIGGYVA